MKYIVILLLLSSCYSQQKARVQLGKAVTTYPEIGAEFCALTYPVKELVKSDTLYKTDTIINGFTFIDTAYIKIRDTVTRTITKTLPNKIVTNTVHIRDTIVKENTAAKGLCEIERNRAIGIATEANLRADKWQGKALTRFWLLLALILLVAGYVGARLMGKIK